MMMSFGTRKKLLLHKIIVMNEKRLKPSLKRLRARINVDFMLIKVQVLIWCLNCGQIFLSEKN